MREKQLIRVQPQQKLPESRQLITLYPVPTVIDSLVEVVVVFLLMYILLIKLDKASFTVC